MKGLIGAGWVSVDVRSCSKGGGLGVRVVAAVLAIVSLVALAGCGKKKIDYTKNLLRNASFEEVEGVLPKYWSVGDFRGLKEQQEVTYGIDETDAQDGSRSWYFDGDTGTRRWRALTQEVEIPDVRRIRLRGWMKLDHVERERDQYAQANFLLTYYDKDHSRFQVTRFADKRTRLKTGTHLWFEADQVFRVPRGTRYVAVTCVLGMSGRIWFDNVSLTVPEPTEWNIFETKNFVFHWMPERPFPPGSMDNEQRIFDEFAGRLGVKSEVVANYYLYPDTAAIRKALSLKGYQYVSWSDVEIHTINPNENHEIVHFITDPYGQPPRALAEGTVFWLLNDWGLGLPNDETAAYLAANKKLPPLESIINYNELTQMDPQIWMPTAGSFIKYIVERWGPDQLIELYRQSTGMNSYATFSTVFERVYGVACSDVESQWREYLTGIDYGDVFERDRGK